jgi:RNA polymerase sigma-70 factor (ECF subfamily)
LQKGPGYEAAPADDAGWLGNARPRLVRLATRLLGNAHEAEEAAQEALLIAWRRAGRVREPGRRNAWLYRTTVNVCMNRLRRRRRTASPVDPTAFDAQPARGDPNDVGGDLARCVRIAMAELPGRQHAAVVLREMEGLVYEDVAAILGTRPATARVLVHRGRETLRLILVRRWPELFGAADA